MLFRSKKGTSLKETLTAEIFICIFQFTSENINESHTRGVLWFRCLISSMNLRTICSPLSHLVVNFPNVTANTKSKTSAFRVTYLYWMSVITKINWILINSTEH